MTKIIEEKDNEKGFVTKKPPLGVNQESIHVCDDCEGTGLYGEEECNLCLGTGWVDH
jgi:DnaJ-class molecular chaperone